VEGHWTLLITNELNFGVLMSMMQFPVGKY
jgi:hypothetical protein